MNNRMVTTDGLRRTTDEQPQGTTDGLRRTTDNRVFPLALAADTRSMRLAPEGMIPG